MKNVSAKYSIIIYKKEMDTETENDILSYLRHGVTVYLFTNIIVDKSKLKNKAEILEAISNMFLVLIDTKNDYFEEGIKSVDNELLDKKFYENVCKVKDNEFNSEYYEIVHSPVEDNVLVRAGAGTGKTTAMINRILYLKHINRYLNLNEIVLITFTNEATIQMREKLIKKIENYYNLTKNHKYLQWLDEVANMNIKTIHSFARDILEKQGEELGFFENFKITTFKYTRQKLIEKYIEEFKNSSQGSIYSEFARIPQHQLIKKIIAIMDKLDNFAVDINAINYNVYFGEDKSGFNIMIEFIIKNVVKELEEIKQQTNSWEMNDLIKKLPNLQFSSQIELNIKVLMVDEFQDTDKIQIDFISWIVESSNAKLFVVGDEKQSIYRFRGADYTAFDQLREKYEQISVDSIKDFNLVRNYRTNKSLLSNIDDWFVNINERVDKFNYEDEDRIYSLKNSEFKNEICIENLEQKSTKTELIKSLLENKKDDEEVCILVRTNSDVKEIKELCDKEGIPCEISSTGDFFRSESVRELYIMIKSLINKNDNDSIYSLLNSSYSCMNINKKQLIESIFSDRSKTKEYLKLQLEEIKWDDYLRLSMIKSPINLIEEIINEIKPELNYYKKIINKFNELEAKVITTEYKMNLDHCLFLIRKNFNGNVATLSTIENYLRINIQTNDIESKKKIGDTYKKNFIKCMTIHKAKGLEYEYIILPITSHEFISHNQDFDLIIDRDNFENVNIGYKVILGNDYKEVSNNIYLQKKYDENEEIKGEETRLFYVALTRAKKELYIHKKSITSSYINSWMTLIPEGEYNV
ncbi:ATP-dependent helicase [Terrisporobacter petrolearius]|uniref:UvrD-helicase domain-containing protein n=1 Tax=Terrisporobacter petrolearius TaxID=1460447 RepID=UPI0031CCBD0D